MHSTRAKDAIDTARADGYASAGAVDDALARKRDNLEHAGKLLDDVLVEYDQTGRWARLDERATRLDIADISERWARGLVAHPFPIALESLRFNWGYMKEHGVRAFYEMTRDYLADLLANTDRGKQPGRPRSALESSSASLPSSATWRASRLRCIATSARRRSAP